MGNQENLLEVRLECFEQFEEQFAAGLVERAERLVQEQELARRFGLRGGGAREREPERDQKLVNRAPAERVQVHVSPALLREYADVEVVAEAHFVVSAPRHLRQYPPEVRLYLRNHSFLDFQTGM